MPKFYSKNWYSDFAQREEPNEPLMLRDKYDYILFFGEDDLNKRIGAYKAIYPKMYKFSQCDPSLIDKILFTLNPKNTNQYIEVWKTKAH
jgi:hypothetical protein